MHATRTSQTLFNIPTLSARGAMLVRIYPQQGIGEPFVLHDGPILIGREACSVTLPDDSISRRHAMIECVDGHHVLMDLRSTNGTYVNECRITETLLQEGDRIRFGKQIFKYLTSDCIESQYHEVVYRIMTTDGLTQVYNKQYFLESLHREIEHGQRSGDPVSVLLLDLDHFKSINDQYGHLAGDAVLAEFARRARGVVRGGEVFARYGGEEFAMLCTRCNESEAIIAAERVRKSVTWAPVQFEDRSIPVTVSIGVASTHSLSTPDPTALLEEADRWLYTAKANGRNQVQAAKLGLENNAIV